MDYLERYGKSYKQVLSEAYADLDSNQRERFLQELHAFLSVNQSREDVVKAWSKLGAMRIPDDLDLRGLLNEFAESRSEKQ